MHQPVRALRRHSRHLNSAMINASGFVPRICDGRCLHCQMEIASDSPQYCRYEGKPCPRCTWALLAPAGVALGLNLILMAGRAAIDRATLRAYRR